MSSAIEINQVSKSYRLGALSRASLQDDVERWWARLRGQPDPFAKIGDDRGTAMRGEFWALKDVTFSVGTGEVIGIIGRNGAGKSTLLKILSQVTAPTAGEVRLRGRVASLLEVGTGFHPDLTGRENVFLNGAILGMTKAEINAKFDEIVAFSECEQFIDTPVKRYSSGMYVRLAFAVAAHLEPEILVVDEVLAVGDAQFQKKCLGKMGDVSRGGRTVLFVSHNMIAVQSLCHRAVLLRDGRLVQEGSAQSVVTSYLNRAHKAPDSVEWAQPHSAPGDDALKVKRIRVKGGGTGDSLIDMTTPIHVETDFWVLRSELQHITYELFNQQGISVLETCTMPERWPVGEYKGFFTLPGRLLNSGTYTLRLVIVRNENRMTCEYPEIVSFTVVDNAARTVAQLARNSGVVQPPLPWVVRAIA
jgi:lipopolysaccharide transport system ATP-binding protein